MYLKTAHGTFVVADGVNRNLLHLPLLKVSLRLLVEVTDPPEVDGIVKGRMIESGPLAGYTVYKTISRIGLNLIKRGHFLCAERKSEQLVCNRLTPAEWERFHLVTKTELGHSLCNLPA